MLYAEPRPPMRREHVVDVRGADVRLQAKQFPGRSVVDLFALGAQLVGALRRRVQQRLL
jgi:hypothetical protein